MNPWLHLLRDRPWLAALFLLAFAHPPTLGTAASARIPDLVIPEGVGVNIHFARGHTADLDLIAQAGFRFIRMDLGWAGTEQQRGQYDWSAFDELTANLEQRGLSAIYILDYSNPLYEETVATRNPITGQEHRDTASPQHPESIAAFARWAAAAARHFRDRPILWEIWNEPNITFWKPKPDVKQYVALAQATCEAIRAAHPRALIIAPATSELPLPFLETFFASGILAHLDGVSVHPYRRYDRPPETALEDYDKLRALIRKHAPRGKRDLPIISGEWGYASHTQGVSPLVQAQFLVRQQLGNLAAGVPISIWYDWKNDGPDLNEREHNFGTVTADLQPKPAYTFLKQMTQQLAGYRIARRLTVGTSQDYVFLLTAKRQPDQLAAWTLNPTSSVTVPAHVKREARVQVVTSTGDAYGAQFRHPDAQTTVQAQVPGAGSVQLDANRLILGLTPSPAYLTLHGIALPSPKSPPKP